MIQLLRASALSALAVAGLATAAAAADLTPVKVLYTPSPDFANAQVALDEGIFEKHGLDVDLSTYVASTTTPVNMLVSGSIDITLNSPTTALQTADAGLDLVIIQGGAVLPSEHTWGIYAMPDSGIETAKDLEGKTFGMIITSGSFEVYFHNWMEANDADPEKVNMVQVPLSSMADFIKSGRMDAGIVATPFLEQIMDDSGAVLIGDIADALPYPVMINAWGATRDYAEANPDVIKAFQESMAEATQLMIDNPDLGHEAMVKSTGLDRDLVFATPFSKIQTELTPDALTWWYDTMKSRDLIVGDYDPATLIYQAPE